MWIAIILGAIAFLLMNHAVVFWVVFVPLIILLVVYVLKFLGGRRNALGDLATVLGILAIMVVALLIVCIP